MAITGGCLCGAVRYAVEDEPLTCRICWCRLCQYLAAGNASVNLTFPTSSFRIEGSPAKRQDKADSGSHMVRSFCATCGTQLFSEARERPHLIVVRAGTLDDPNIARPVATIWTSEAPSWACIDPALDRFEGQPPPLRVPQSS